MKPIKITLWTFFIGLSLLWVMADSFVPEPFNYTSLRQVLIQYSGVITMGAMSLCMILAMRLPIFERLLNGLDKGYRLHKWLGIAALSSSLFHWWMAKGSKWMAQWGWVELIRRKKPEGGMLENSTMNFQQWLGSQRGFAEDIGEWAFYLAVFLIVMALVKRIPYRWFIKLHKWLAVGYLALVVHAVILIKYEYWSQPIGWVMAVLLMGGTISAILILTNRVGKKRQVSGKISTIDYSPRSQIMTMTVDLEKGWQGHQAGQFAFIQRMKDKEQPHPYTISSAWDPNKNQLNFMIKVLGDYTRQMSSTWRAGDTLNIEGPYGKFTFEDNKAQQIWVAGGIGITPFMAKLQQLATQKHNKQIDLFYSLPQAEIAQMEMLQYIAEQANVRLHLIESQKMGRLTGEKIRHLVPNWQQASIWFCGSSTFAQQLKQDFATQKFEMKHFHQELFEMR